MPTQIDLKGGMSRIGTLNSKFSPAIISTKLGFKPEKNPNEKVRWMWVFEESGLEMAIWDYRGGKWSIVGHNYTEDVPKVIDYLGKLFGEENVSDDGFGRIR